MTKYTFNIAYALFCVGLLFIAHNQYEYDFINNYTLSVFMFTGINIIIATSLNLVNGNMGEFSCGHAAFICVGAYVSSILSVLCFGSKFGDPLFPAEYAMFLFPVVIIIGGLVASLAGILVAVPSFKTRGDYLAIITIAVNYMIISGIENMKFIGGPSGFMGMKDTVWAMVDTIELPWMLFWVLVFMTLTVWIIRRFVSSTYGKGVNAICQDEVAAEIMSVNTNKMKIVNFMLSSGLAGIAGGLFAHIVGFINPSAFGILKSTEAMVMVYLGGMGSLSGAVLSAILFTALLEVLRSQSIIDFILTPVTAVIPDWEPSAGVIKWVLIPLILVLLMQFRPEGIMGNRELSDFFPKLKRFYSFK